AADGAILYTFLPAPGRLPGIQPTSIRRGPPMQTTRLRIVRAIATSLFLTSTLAVAAQAQRPMTFLDVQEMRRVGSTDLSPDGRWLLYTVSFPDWEKAERQNDIFLVSTREGLPSTKQMTFTAEKDETSPTWSRDGSFFVFASNRDAANNGGQRQLYLMRPDGGEARKLTSAKDGVADFAFSRDGSWLVYRAGKSGEQQLYRLPVASIVRAAPEEIEPEQLTKQSAGVGNWELTRDSRRIYFIAADTLDADDRE